MVVARVFTEIQCMFSVNGNGMYYILSLTCLDRPNPPYNIRIGNSEIKARSMDIYWSEGNTNFGPIRNYTIQYRKRGAVDWETVEKTVGPGSTSYIVHG